MTHILLHDTQDAGLPGVAGGLASPACGVSLARLGPIAGCSQDGATLAPGIFLLPWLGHSCLVGSMGQVPHTALLRPDDMVLGLALLHPCFLSHFTPSPLSHLGWPGAVTASLAGQPHAFSSSVWPCTLAPSPGLALAALHAGRQCTDEKLSAACTGHGEVCSAAQVSGWHHLRGHGRRQ